MKTTSPGPFLSTLRVGFRILLAAVACIAADRTLPAPRAAGASGGLHLINVDFTTDKNAQYVVKSGPAAVGNTAEDFWNVYSRDDGQGGFRPGGSIALSWADATSSPARLSVANAPGAWPNGVTADPMYNVYLYPLDGGEISVEIQQLPVGTYDLYVYGHGARDDQNGVYEVTAGGRPIGVLSTVNGPGWGNVRWTEGAQYVRLVNVAVREGDTLHLAVRRGASGYALISGLQLLAHDAGSAAGDGIPDAWRVRYFGSVSDPRAAATADPDGDGANNYREYLDGTHPTSRSSVARVPVAIENYAGAEPGGRDGALASATFICPLSLRRDPQGRFWVAEGTWTGWYEPIVGAHRVRLIDPVAGTVRTVAGGTEPGYVDGPAANARFTTPANVALDHSGNAFITERHGHRIRKISTDGIVTTFAGSVAGNRDGQGTKAMFHSPVTAAMDPYDNLYVADFDNYSIRKISPDGNVTTLAGNGLGYVDGDLAAARFNSPCYVSLRFGTSPSPLGTVFVSDYVNGMIRQIGPGGQVSTLISGLPLVENVAVGPEDRLYVSVPDGPSLKQYDLDGRMLWSVQVGSGLRDGPIGQAKAGRLNELEFLPDGQILFPDGWNARIRRLVMGVNPLLTATPPGAPFSVQTNLVLSTVVSNGVIRYTLDGTEPLASSSAYSRTLVLSSTATVKARVFVNGFAVSEVVTAAFTRTDDASPADGIPSAWRVRYFGAVDDPRAAATADPDGDGANNYQEYLNGTNPQNAASRPRVPLSVSTYAGSDAGTNDGCYRTQARFNVGAGLTLAPDGSCWVWESNVENYDHAGPGLHRIRRIDTNGMVATVAGAESALVDGPLAAARFVSPSGLVFDSKGNAFVSDRMGHRVRKIADGRVTTLAGSTRGYRDGQRTEAQFGLLAHLAIDADDNLFVTDFDNCRIRKITPDGTVSTYAGSTSGDRDGDRLEAQFNGPGALAFDARGNLFFSDWGNHKLRRISADGMVATFASDLLFVWDVSLDPDNNVYTLASGTGVYSVFSPEGETRWTLNTGATGDYDPSWDGPIASAKFGRIGVGSFVKNGDMWFSDGPRVRILHLGVPPLLSAVPPGGGTFKNRLMVGLNTSVTHGTIRYTRDGTVPTAASDAFPGSIVLGTSTCLKARVFVNGSPVSEVLEATYARSDVESALVRPSGDVTVATLAGSGQTGMADGASLAATFNHPNGGRVDAQGNVLIADSGNHRIRRVASRGVVTTLAGAGTEGYADGPAASARFNQPLAVCAGPAGVYYVADTGNNRIRKIDADGQVTTVAGDGVAGYLDGPAATARFNFPNDLAVDSQGVLWMVEFYSHAVRRLGADGIVTTIAGTGTAGYLDGPGDTARFDHLGGLALAPDGGIVVSEWGGARIRRIAPDGLVSTVAGCGLVGWADGPAFTARFRNPDGLAVSADGVVYVADNGNHAIRRIQPDGQVLTVAGAAPGGFLDGAGASALFANPAGLGILPGGDLVVPDFVNQRVRIVVLGAAIPTTQATRILPASYLPGATFAVKIVVVPATNATAYAVEDQLPEGWTIGAALSDGAQYDAQRRTVRFGPFLEQSTRTLSYEVRTPHTPTGTARFNGLISADGSQAEIGGDIEIAAGQYHPADLQPSDFRLSVGELTAYGAAWKRGDAWTVAPSPIPIGYVTRAAYLWRNGENYRYDDTSGLQPPLAWVLDSGVIRPNESPTEGAADLTGTEFALVDALRLLDESNSEAAATLPANAAMGEALPVRIAVRPRAGVLVYAVEELLPASWTATDISHDGFLDPATGKVKWGPFFDASTRELSYRAVAPSRAAGTFEFAGVASFDGVDVAVGGARRVSLATGAGPILTATVGADGTRAVELSLPGMMGAKLQIDTSEDLLQWQSALTVTNMTGSVSVRDPALLRPSRLFFRIRPVE